MAAKFVSITTHKVRAVTVVRDDIQSILQKKNLRGSDLPSQIRVRAGT